MKYLGTFLSISASESNHHKTNNNKTNVNADKYINFIDPKNRANAVYLLIGTNNFALMRHPTF
jgi:hypothetical protein